MSKFIITSDFIQEFKQEFKKELLEDLRQFQYFQTTDKPLRYLRSTEVMDLLKISPGTLQNLRINGTLPYTKIGGTIFYEANEIQKVMEKNRVKKNRVKKKSDS